MVWGILAWLYTWVRKAPVQSTRTCCRQRMSDPNPFAPTNLAAGAGQRKAALPVAALCPPGLRRCLVHPAPSRRLYHSVSDSFYRLGKRAPLAQQSVIKPHPRAPPSFHKDHHRHRLPGPICVGEPVPAGAGAGVLLRGRIFGGRDCLAAGPVLLRTVTRLAHQPRAARLVACPGRDGHLPRHSRWTGGPPPDPGHAGRAAV